jgi:hypothetical protein
MLPRRAGLLSFIPCRGLELRHSYITASLKFLVHVLIPAGMIGADARLHAT